MRRLCTDLKKLSWVVGLGGAACWLVDARTSAILDSVCLVALADDERTWSVDVDEIELLGVDSEGKGAVASASAGGMGPGC